MGIAKLVQVRKKDGKDDGDEDLAIKLNTRKVHKINKLDTQISCKDITARKNAAKKMLVNFPPTVALCRCLIIA